MTPLLRAQQWYEHYIPNEHFGAALADFIVQPGNVVISRPDVFLMAEQVRWDGEAKRIVEGEANAWYCRLAAVADGVAPWSTLMAAAPHGHEWLVWVRRNDGQRRARLWKDLRAKTGGK
jgi:hypothetical protein